MQQAQAAMPALPRRKPILPNGTLGMLIFVLTEVMLFTGMVSAFAITKATAGPLWPPPGQPRLPIEETAFNTFALLLSGALLFYAARAFKAKERKARGFLLASILLGAFFVIFQGIEWVALLNEGLTLTSSNHGSFFYLIVGTHGLHAVASLILLARAFLYLLKDKLDESMFGAAQVLWYFVVAVWPVLYQQVYL